MSPLAHAIDTAPARTTASGGTTATRTTADRTTGAAPLRDEEISRLRLVVPAAARTRVSFPALCVLALVVGILGVLLLNIYISHSTFRVEQLAAEQARLHEERDRLTEDIAYRESPQNIAQAAEELGMQRDLTPEYIRLSDGRVLSPGEVAGSSLQNRETVPGPRADARQDVRPNLRSEETLPAVGGGPVEFDAPSQRAPR